MGGKASIIEGLIKAIGAEAPAAKSGIRAYHSSPHDFDRFDLSKLGTGEGNQTYGHGLYFAESPKVSGQGGDYWRQFWNKMKPGPEASAANALWANKFDREKAAAALESQARYSREHAQPGRYGDGPDIEEGNRLLAEEYERALELLRNGETVGPRTYEVDINARPDQLLDWDKPLSEQPEAVRDILRDGYKKAGINGVDSFLHSTEHFGRDAYESLGRSLSGGSGSKTASPMAASHLREAGVPGIKYLDGVSRSAGKGTNNYVVFDDSLIDIRKKYASGGPVAEPAPALGMARQRKAS